MTSALIELIDLSAGGYECNRRDFVNNGCWEGVDFTGWIHSKTSNGRRLSQILLLAIGACFCVGLPLWAQTPTPQTADGNKSWTATTESQSANVNPTRTTESHSQSGNHAIDKQSVQRRGPDGNFEPFQDIEKQSVQVNAARCANRHAHIRLGKWGANVHFR